MAAFFRTFVISTVVVLLGLLGNHWSNKYALNVPTIFYTIEQNENNEKEFILINIINSSNIVIDSLNFNTNVPNIIDIEFRALKNKNTSKDTTKWQSRVFPGENLKVFIYCTKTPNFNYIENITNSISGKYRDNKDFLWKDVELINGTPGFKLFLLSVFWYALPFSIVLIIYLPIWVIVSIRNKKTKGTEEGVKKREKEKVEE